MLGDGTKLVSSKSNLLSWWVWVVATHKRTNTARLWISCFDSLTMAMSSVLGCRKSTF
jgi:hypothetical protein